MADEDTSIAATVAALDAPLPEKEEPVAQTPPAEPAPAAEVETDTEIEGDPTPEDAEAPEEASEGEDAETAELEEVEQTLPAIEPPHFWDAAAKKQFGDLPRALQELVLSKEVERDKVVASKFEEAAKVRKAAQDEASKLATFTGELDKLIPQAKATFQSKWGTGEIDWAKVTEERGIEEAFVLKNQYDAESRQLQQLESAKEAVEKHEAEKTATLEAERIKQFKIDRDEQFKTIIPDFVDPKVGQARQLEVVQYLAKSGIAPEITINAASAQELSIAYKAMLYDKAQAEAAKLAKAPKPPATPSRTPVRPTAQPVRGSQQSAKVQAAQAAWDKDPSIKNLLALEQAQG